MYTTSVDISNAYKHGALYAFVLLLVLFSASFFVHGDPVLGATKRLTASVRESVPKEHVSDAYHGTHASSLGTESVVAQAALVIDLNTKEILFQKNASMELPLASVTKLLTAYVVAERTRPDELVIISPESLSKDGDWGLIPYDQWNVRDLLSFMMITSSNDAAAALAEHVGYSIDPTASPDGARFSFISVLNKRAKELGMQHTTVTDEAGLDTSLTTAGAYGSAEDVALLLSEIQYRYPYILESSEAQNATFTARSGKRYNAHTTNKAIPEIPGFIGGKTGFTDIAGGNLTIVFDRDIGNSIAVVVLGSTKEGRFSDVVSLVQSVM